MILKKIIKHEKLKFWQHYIVDICFRRQKKGRGQFSRESCVRRERERDRERERREVQGIEGGKREKSGGRESKQKGEG